MVSLSVAIPKRFIFKKLFNFEEKNEQMKKSMQIT